MKRVSEWTAYFWTSVHGRHLQDRLDGFVKAVQEDAMGASTEKPVVVEAPDQPIERLADQDDENTPPMGMSSIDRDF